MSLENLQTMIMQNSGGGKRGVLWDCASSEYKIIHFQSENTGKMFLRPNKSKQGTFFFSKL